MPGLNSETRLARALAKYRAMSNDDLSAELQRLYDGEHFAALDREALLDAIAERLEATGP